MSRATNAAASGATDGSGTMFDRIAGRYDLLNHLMSGGMDRRWRKKLVESLAVGGTARVLDVATGTADVAIAVAQRHGGAQLVGLDPSSAMLAIGRDKVENQGLAQRIELMRGTAEMLPFANDSFDAACVSFGIRNVADRPQALREMRRVTRPGGHVCVLELSEPRKGALSGLARLHVHHVVPRLGALLSRSDEYRYLQRSIEAFPPPAEFVAMMQQADLHDVTARPMSFGAVHLFVGTV